MASDEIIWSVINQQFCSYKLKTTKDQTFCRNEYNVTGLCSRQACPLANSRYATIRSNPETGVLYLFMKTAERSHMPSKWWERIRLSGNYAKALEQIDERLIYWPKFLVHKCKQRLTRLTQVAIRTKRLAKEEERLGEKVVSRVAPKVRRREETRERKAEAAAKVERAIERELIDRLKSGAYGENPLNVEENIWKKVLRGLEREGKGTRDKDLDEGIEEEEEQQSKEEIEWEEDQLDGVDVEYVSDIEGDSDDDIDDLEDWVDRASEGESTDEEEQVKSVESDVSENESDQDEKLRQKLENLKRKRSQGPSKAVKKRAAKGPKMEIEYETETTLREQVLA